VNKHQKMLAWSAPAGDNEAEGRSEADIKNGAALMEEMALQRDLLFRKKELASKSADQAKRDCQTDIRKLTSENAQLITEMNTLRAENKSYLRSCKELEAKIMAMRDLPGQQKAGLGAGDPSTSGMSHSSSAPDVGSAAGRPGARTVFRPTDGPCQARRPHTCGGR